MIAYAPFIPHTLEHLTEAHVFPAPLPEAFYSKICAEYQSLNDVTVQRITYPSDRLTVTGLSALPAAIRPGSHPILIYNRGGSGNYGMLTVLSAMRSMVPFAQQSMLVFASNYRGNDGGDGIEEFGGRDVDDVLTLLEQAKTHPGWDGKNIFMLGHSRGAMMNYLAIKRGAPLNAAVSLAGVADLRLSLDVRPQMEKVYQRYIPHINERREELLTDRSALSWPEKITVPTQLQHGLADEVVSDEHSRLLAQAFAAQGLAHELHLHEGGNHALIRVWDTVLQHANRWFEEYRQ